MSRWIPVDERLPELHREQYVPHPYLSQATFNDYYLMSEPVLVSRECEDADWRIVVAQYEDDLDGRTYWETMDAEILTGVNAWMPLPEPYTADTPQTDAEITELAKEIVHKMIDNSDIAEDAYPDLRQRMHEAVERLDEYYPSEDGRSE